MGQHFLYSTNVFLKQYIQQRYAGDVHYAWCSEEFNSNSMAAYAPGALVAPSSNPADIYRELARDVGRADAHSGKIAAQKLSFNVLAIQWEQNGRITPNQRDDILYIVQTAAFQFWRPLVYVIPRVLVHARIQPVSASKCAGLGPEYIIPDLQRSEFDLIEL